jgi:hypothetical protein
MNAIGETAGVDRRGGKERILTLRMQKKEDPRSQTTGGVPLGMTLGGSVKVQKTRELGVHFSSRASTRATL